MAHRNVSDAIQVRTPRDREQEEHERKLMESIAAENVNPFQRIADAVLEPVAYVYSNYLYSTGVMFLALSFWTVYPSFVRYRHTHILRYRRNQLTLRRWMFGTPHMPKWDKKYLQRIVVPPPPAPEFAVEDIVERGKLRNTVQEEAQKAESAGGRATTATEMVSQAEPEAQLTTEAGASAKVLPLFQERTIGVSTTSRARFAGDYEAESQQTILKELAVINNTFYGDGATRFDSKLDVATAKQSVYSCILGAIEKGNAAVVLRETSKNMRSVPPGWAVLWVSAQEEQRKRTCIFWLISLLCARALQDLLFMPEMPAIVN